MATEKEIRLNEKKAAMQAKLDELNASPQEVIARWDSYMRDLLPKLSDFTASKGNVTMKQHLQGKYNELRADSQKAINEEKAYYSAMIAKIDNTLNKVQNGN